MFCHGLWQMVFTCGTDKSDKGRKVSIVVYLIDEELIEKLSFFFFLRIFIAILPTIMSLVTAFDLSFLVRFIIFQVAWISLLLF